MKDWDALYEECIHCQKCGLAETRTNVVFGEGARDAEVMFIGEGPGEQEDRTGRPFVGRAGQLLDDMLAMIDLKREKVFIGNMVKCRPPQNRDPLNIEQEACIGYLRNQVALLKPKIIVCLGRIAAMKLIKEDFKITREHGQWIEKAGVWMMAMYHPSALLRDPRKRPESFEDLKSLQAKIRETREHGQWIEKAGVWMMAMYHPSALLRDPRKRPESFEDLKSLQAKIREVCVRTY